jgi:hypothetical protein
MEKTLQGMEVVELLVSAVVAVEVVHTGCMTRPVVMHHRNCPCYLILTYWLML